MNYAMFCQFSLRTRAFYTWSVHISPYISPRCKKNQPVPVLLRNDAKIFKRGILLVVVMSRPSSVESTMSVHRDGERNVCFTVDRVH